MFWGFAFTSIDLFFVAFGDNEKKLTGKVIAKLAVGRS